jgi:hypothetical protein
MPNGEATRNALPVMADGWFSETLSCPAARPVDDWFTAKIVGKMGKYARRHRQTTIVAEFLTSAPSDLGITRAAPSDALTLELNRWRNAFISAADFKW